MKVTLRGYLVPDVISPKCLSSFIMKRAQTRANGRPHFNRLNEPLLDGPESIYGSFSLTNY